MLAVKLMYIRKRGPDTGKYCCQNGRRFKCPTSYSHPTVIEDVNDYENNNLYGFHLNQNRGISRMVIILLAFSSFEIC